MSRTEIRITGLGGQGVVLSGHIIGRACAVHAGRHATMIQSFGPEARGSACTTTLAVSGEEVLYPYIREPDVLVAMSSEGYDKYAAELKEDGILIYERDLVAAEVSNGQRAYGICSTRIAEELGRTIVQNIVMLGCFAAATRIVDRDAMRAAVEASVPEGTEQLNLKAFDAGWAFFEREYGAATGTGATPESTPEADGPGSEAAGGEG